MTTAFQSNAFQKNAFQITTAVTVVDTHDGSDSKRREDAFRKRQEALRAMVLHAFEAEFELPIFAAVRKIAGTKGAPISASQTEKLAKVYDAYLDELQEQQEEEELLMVLH